MSIRKHYMTLVAYDDLVVTCKVENDNKVYATYEKAYEGGFKTAVLDMSNKVISNRGFDNSEMKFITDFNKGHSDTIEECARSW